MSGGQMQRVAIARALVNDPDILLADEPTGALDTHTSVQIMELIKEISKDKLVIMVTHNPELAEEYSSRIVRLSDGLVVSDSDPVSDEEAAAMNAEYISKKDEEQNIDSKAAKKAKKEEKKRRKKEKTSMSFMTALSLSTNNLMTKKGRTALTSFAGSIGIIGIALILSLSNGIQVYIDQVQEDTLSTFPLTISRQTQDYESMVSALTKVEEDQASFTDPNKIYVDDSMGTMMSAMSSTVTNDLEAFDKYLNENYDNIKDSVLDIQRTYDFDLQIFTGDGKTQVNPTTIFKSMGSAFAGIGEMMESTGMSGSMGVMSEMINNQELLDQQYELVGENSRWPEEANEVVLVVGRNNQISKMALYMLGVLDQGELEEIMTALMTTGEYNADPIEPFDIDDFLGMKFKLLNTSQFYKAREDMEKEGNYYLYDGVKYPVWDDIRNLGYDQETFVTENGTEIVISGIVRPREGATATSISGSLGYTKGLTDLILEWNTESEVIAQQKATPTHNVLTGLKFDRTHYTPENIDELIAKIDRSTMEQFYAIATKMVLEDPAFKDMLNVNDETSFYTMFMFVPSEVRLELLENILTAASASSPEKVKALFDFVSLTTNPHIDITAENFITLYPSLDLYKHVMLSLNGLDVKGLMELAGEEAMGKIFASVGATDAQTFMGAFMMAKPEAKEAITEMLNAAKANDPKGTADLFAFLSTTAGKEITADNFLTLLPTLDPTTQVMLSLAGYKVDGLMSIAGKEAMALVHSKLNALIPSLTVTDEIFLAYMSSGNMTVDNPLFIQLEEALYNMAPQIDETYDSTLKLLGDAEKAKPASINFYAKSFEDKDAIKDFIAEYNDTRENKMEEIKYNDIVGALMDGVSIIINVISYVLIAFVSISLVVSSIMIGIITYISVLERTKEIGILRSIGASKKDISRVFNAETLIVGFAAGAVGIIFTLLINIPINAIIYSLTNIPGVKSVLPPVAAIILVAISMFLTFVAGLIPSKLASKKDPVEALRSE
ncbi:MAG: FtsX-like permease family protein [Clostridia bacterium]|nr:FtsX-like permease family protein [Clostridia bacterium]